MNFPWGVGGFGSNGTFVGMLGPGPGPKCMNMHWLPLYIYISILYIYIFGGVRNQGCKCWAGQMGWHRFRGVPHWFSGFWACAPSG